MGNGVPVYRLFTLFMAALFAAVFTTWPLKGKGITMKTSQGKAEGIIRLPPPRYDGETSVEKALRERRSVREYGNEPLTLSEIGQILWAAQGVTSPLGLRTAPSAGALYPLETYVVAGDVEGLPSGVYRYKPDGHLLLHVAAGDRRGALCSAALSQPAIIKAPAAIVFSAVFARATAKYGKRGIRYVHMDLGHAAENVYLQAVSLRLGTVFIGAFDDDSVKKALSMPPEEEPLCIMPVGRR
jgi:SagB-type dehydrogenase family enzyme